MVTGAAGAIFLAGNGGGNGDFVIFSLCVVLVALWEGVAGFSQFAAGDIGGVVASVPCLIFPIGGGAW